MNISQFFGYTLLKVIGGIIMDMKRINQIVNNDQKFDIFMMTDLFGFKN